MLNVCWAEGRFRNHIAGESIDVDALGLSPASTAMLESLIPESCILLIALPTANAGGVLANIELVLGTHAMGNAEVAMNIDFGRVVSGTTQAGISEINWIAPSYLDARWNRETQQANVRLWDGRPQYRRSFTYPIVGTVEGSVLGPLERNAGGRNFEPHLAAALVELTQKALEQAPAIQMGALPE